MGPSTFNFFVVRMYVAAGARYFVQSISSFATMLAVMSPYMERTYIPRKSRLEPSVLDEATCDDHTHRGGWGWNCAANEGETACSAPCPCSGPCMLLTMHAHNHVPHRPRTRMRANARCNTIAIGTTAPVSGPCACDVVRTNQGPNHAWCCE